VQLVHLVAQLAEAALRLGGGLEGLGELVAVRLGVGTAVVSEPEDLAPGVAVGLLGAIRPSSSSDLRAG